MYRDAILPALGRRLKPVLAQDVLRNGTQSDLLSAIRHSRVVVADVTQPDPDIFYQMGLAHAFAKRTFLISKGVSRLPTRMSEEGVFVYTDNPGRLEALQVILREAFMSVPTAAGQKVRPPTRLAESVMRAAEDARSKKRFGVAIARYEEALALLRATGQREGAAATLNNLAMVRLLSGDPEGASNNLRTALKLTAAADRAERAWLYTNLAAAQERVGDLEAAEEGYLRSRRLFREAGDEAGYATASDTLAAVFLRIGQNKRAKRYVRDALKASSRPGLTAVRAKALLTSAEVNLTKGGPRSREHAGRLVKEAEETLENGDDQEVRAGIAHVKAAMRLMQADKSAVGGAIRFASRSIRIRRGLDDQVWLAASLALRAQAYAAGGRFARALEDLRGARKIQARLKDRSGLVQTLRVTAALFAKINEPEEAKETAEAAERLARSIQLPRESRLQRRGRAGGRSGPTPGPGRL